MKYRSDIGTDFLRFLMGDEGEGVYEIRYKADNPSASPRKIWFTSPAEAERELTHAVSSGNHVWVGVAARRDNSSGEKKNLLYSDWLWCDLDFKNYPAGEAEAKRRLAEYPRRPTVAVLSGGGIQAYWKIERTDLTSEENRSQFESRLKQIAAELQGDSSAAEAARVLRVAGTYNIKAVYEKPRLVKRSRELAEREAIYSLSAFPMLPSVKKSSSPTPRRALSLQSGNILDRIVEKAINRSVGSDRHSAGVYMATQLRDNQTDADDLQCYSEAEAESAMLRFQSAVESAKDHLYTAEEALSTFHRIWKTAAREPWAKSSERVDLPAPSGRRKTKANASSSDTSSEEEPSEEEVQQTFCPFEKTATQLHTAFRKNRVNVEKLFLRFAADVDREELVNVGKAINQAEQKMTTLLRFLWGQWYLALPTGGGKKARILEAVFGRQDSQYFQTMHRKLTDSACVIRKMLVHLPKPELWRTDRNWNFYETLTKVVPPDDWECWLLQPLNKGVNLTQQMVERYAQENNSEDTKSASTSQKPPPIESEESSEDNIGGGLPSAHTPSSDNMPDGAVVLSVPRSYVDPDTGEVEVLSVEAQKLMFRKFMDAVHHADRMGIKVEDYLNKNIPPVEYVAEEHTPMRPAEHTAFDEQLIADAQYRVWRNNAEKDVDEQVESYTHFPGQLSTCSSTNFEIEEDAAKNAKLQSDDSGGFSGLLEVENPGFAVVQTAVPVNDLPAIVQQIEAPSPEDNQTPHVCWRCHTRPALANQFSPHWCLECCEQEQRIKETGTSDTVPKRRSGRMRM